jgi:sRNA-binding regulator protein Hfq
MKDTMTEGSFLRGLIDNETACAVFIQNGCRLEGRLVANDEHCLFLHSAAKVGAQVGVTILIMKAAVSSIVPVRCERSKEMAEKGSAARATVALAQV